MNNVDLFYEILDANDMSITETVELFLNYHGTTLLSDDFVEFIEDEGYYVPKQRR